MSDKPISHVPADRRIERRRVAALVALAGVACGSMLGAGGCKSSAKVGAESGTRGGAIGGRYIAAVCDADMSADSMVTRELGALDPRAKDTLTVVSLPIVEPTTPFAQIHVSNSALGPPRCLCSSPDGGRLYVVESRGEAPENARTLDDLPPGENLTVIDVRNPLEPQVVQSVYIGTEPMSVAVSPKGDFIAMTTRTPGQQLVIARLVDGLVQMDSQQQPQVLGWPMLNVESAEDLRPSCISWRPSAGGGSTDTPALAVTIPERNEVVFYTLTQSPDGELTMAPWDRPVQVGKYPYSGSFTPDGRFFVVANMGWGVDVAGFSAGAAPGEVSVVRLGTVERQSGQTVTPGEPHQLVSSAGVGISPEGLAISPNGRYVVTANAQGAASPDIANLGSKGGSLSLLSLDGNGALRTVGEYPINAVPAGVTFDASGSVVGVTQFRSFDPNAIDGEVGFWRLVPGSNPRLEPMDFYVGLGKGPHAITIVK